MKILRGNLFAILIAICAVGILACAGYLAYNYWYLPKSIEEDNQRYAKMYDPDAALAPEAPAGISAQDDANAQPAPDDMPLGTPNPDTLVYAAPTLPPVQSSFSALLNVNPETVGFLSLGESLALPVAQRENDNSFYLEHSFEGEESDAGCLFLDGANWLFPRDDCLYVYGHNMKNGAMFGRLTRLSEAAGLIEASPAYFDTIYENGVYVPFACVELTADESSESFFSLRRFSFTEEEFDNFVRSLKSRSLLDVPVDVVYGDRLLILVTCDYSIDDGRFAVAYRQLREGETAEEAMAQVRLAK